MSDRDRHLTAAPISTSCGKKEVFRGSDLQVRHKRRVLMSALAPEVAVFDFFRKLSSQGASDVDVRLGVQRGSVKPKSVSRLSRWESGKSSNDRNLGR